MKKEFTAIFIIVVLSLSPASAFSISEFSKKITGFIINSGEQTDGLIAYYEFENNSKDSAKSHDGENNGAVFVEESSSYSAKFNSTEKDYIKIAGDKDLEFGTGNFSIAALVYVESGEHGTFISKGLVGECCDKNGYPGWFLGKRGGKIKFRIEDDALGLNPLMVSAPNINYDKKWVHVVGVRDSEIKLYIDGVLVDRKKVPENYSLNTQKYDVGIGASLYWSSGLHLNGMLDEVRIYNKALSNQEIQAHYQRFNEADKKVSPVTTQAIIEQENSNVLVCNDLCDGADVNNDGVVNSTDLELYRNKIGSSGCTENQGWCGCTDTNRDGVVNVSDNETIMNNLERRDCFESCEDECYTNGTKECFQDGYKTCGNFDNDACLEFGALELCGVDEACSEGECIQTTSSAEVSSSDISGAVVCQLGCLKPDNTCALYESRFDYRGDKGYCASDGKIRYQKSKNSICIGNFECLSNVCQSELCAEISLSPLEGGINLLNRILCRIRHPLSSENYEECLE